MPGSTTARPERAVAAGNTGRRPEFLKRGAVQRALHLLLVLCCGVASHAGEDGDLTVFAAASAGESLTIIAKAYEKLHGGHVVVSAAASSILARQIEHGAPADLFLSADEGWMDYLAAKQAIKPETRRDLLGNSLVLVAPAGSTTAVTVAAGFDIAGAFTGRFAIGDPASVPAGIYARQAFEHLGWWTALTPRLAPAADVRAALRLVEIGEAGLGVVYNSDVIGATKVVVVATIPSALHAPIRYPLALTATAKPRAAELLAYITGVEAASVFSAHGLTVLYPVIAPVSP